MLWPVDKRVRYEAIRARMTSAEGKRMRCIKGALHAHAAMRAEGRVPGDEGRAAIMLNRETKRRNDPPRQLDEMRVLTDGAAWLLKES
jgi:hypothetical protein